MSLSLFLSCAPKRCAPAAGPGRNSFTIIALTPPRRQFGPAGAALWRSAFSPARSAFGAVLFLQRRCAEADEGLWLTEAVADGGEGFEVRLGLQEADLAPQPFGVGRQSIAAQASRQQPDAHDRQLVRFSQRFEAIVVEQGRIELHPLGIFGHAGLRAFVVDDLKKSPARTTLSVSLLWHPCLVPRCCCYSQVLARPALRPRPRRRGDPDRCRRPCRSCGGL